MYKHLRATTLLRARPMVQIFVGFGNDEKGRGGKGKRWEKKKKKIKIQDDHLSATFVRVHVPAKCASQAHTFFV